MRVTSQSLFAAFVLAAAVPLAHADYEITPACAELQSKAFESYRAFRDETYRVTQYNLADRLSGLQKLKGAVAGDKDLQALLKQYDQDYDKYEGGYYGFQNNGLPQERAKIRKRLNDLVSRNAGGPMSMMCPSRANGEGMIDPQITGWTQFRRGTTDEIMEWSEIWDGEDPNTQRQVAKTRLTAVCYPTKSGDEVYSDDHGYDQMVEPLAARKVVVRMSGGDEKIMVNIYNYNSVRGEPIYSVSTLDIAADIAHGGVIKDTTLDESLGSKRLQYVMGYEYEGPIAQSKYASGLKDQRNFKDYYLEYLAGHNHDAAGNAICNEVKPAPVVVEHPELVVPKVEEVVQPAKTDDAGAKSDGDAAVKAVDPTPPQVEQAQSGPASTDTAGNTTVVQ